MNNKQKLFESIARIKQARDVIFKTYLNYLPAAQHHTFKDVFGKINTDLTSIELLLGNEITLMDIEKED